MYKFKIGDKVILLNPHTVNIGYKPELHKKEAKIVNLCGPVRWIYDDIIFPNNYEIIVNGERWTWREDQILLPSYRII